MFRSNWIATGSHDLPLYSIPVSVKDDIARLRIDRCRPARTFPFHPLGRADQALGIGLASGLRERLVDETHAIVLAVPVIFR